MREYEEPQSSLDGGSDQWKHLLALQLLYRFCFRIWREDICCLLTRFDTLDFVCYLCECLARLPLCEEYYGYGACLIA
jgi:hypothetical protein